MVSLGRVQGISPGIHGGGPQFTMTFSLDHSCQEIYSFSHVVFILSFFSNYTRLLEATFPTSDKGTLQVQLP